MRRAVCDPRMRMTRKAASTAEIQSSISRNQSVCRTVAGRRESGLRSGMDLLKCTHRFIKLPETR